MIKDRIYATRPVNLAALKDAIILEMQRLPEKLCQRACQSVTERLQLFKNLHNEHIENFCEYTS